jgi:hypothetical protein
VSDINQAIVDARKVNDLGGAAVLRITLKDAERMYERHWAFRPSTRHATAVPFYTCARLNLLSSIYTYVFERYKFFVAELRAWLRGPDNLPLGDARAAEADACSALLQT